MRGVRDGVALFLLTVVVFALGAVIGALVIGYIR
jgi:hypothetical protein